MAGQVPFDFRKGCQRQVTLKNEPRKRVAGVGKVCKECGKVFDSNLALGAHRNMQHGVKQDAFVYAQGTECWVCLKDFWTTDRYKDHLRKTGCLRKLVEADLGPPETQPQIKAVSRSAHLPILTKAGPQNWWAILKPAETVLGETSQLDFESQQFENLALMLRRIDNLVATGPEIGMNWRVLVEGVAGIIWAVIQHDSSLQDEIGSVLAACSVILSTTREGEFVERLLGMVEWVILGEQEYVDCTEDAWTGRLWAPGTAWVLDWTQTAMSLSAKRPTAAKYLLHLFSGRRRENDLQFFVEELQQAVTSYRIEVLSVDLAAGGDSCDLCCPIRQEVFLRLIRTLIVVGIMAGPPYETWSSSRWADVTPLLQAGALLQHVHHKRPLPLRSKGAPWGWSWLRETAHCQTRTGSLLLQFTLLAFAEAYLHHVAMALGHPEEPEGIDMPLPSIWGLRVTQELMTLPGVSCVSVPLAWYGAASWQPTRFLVTGMPTFQDRLRALADTTRRPGNSSIGVEHSTVSKLKEYPPALCRGLAEAFLDVARARSGPVQPVDTHTQQWLQNLYVQWDPYLPTAMHCD